MLPHTPACPSSKGVKSCAAAPFASNALPSCAASASIVGRARMAAAPGDESAREARGIRAEVAMDTSSIE